MAGITSAKKLAERGLTKARVLGQGSFIDSEQEFDYYVLQLLNKYGESEEIYLQITYGGCDVQVEDASNIDQNDFLELIIHGDYDASWRKVKE